jgi:hypothetical protein
MSQDSGEKIDTALVKAADMVAASTHDAQKALHLSQAVLNLAHAKAIVQGTKPSTSK